MKEIKTLEKEIIPFIGKAQSITITGPKEMSLASEIRTQLKTYAKTVKTEKDKILKPQKEALDAIKDMFAPLEDKIESTLKVIDNEMISYQTSQKETADKKAAEITARVGEGKGKLKIETAINKIEAIDKPENKISTESGGTIFVTVPCFEIQDISKIPFEFLIPNEVKIRLAMKTGTKLPGIRYWTEERPKNTQ